MTILGACIATLVQSAVFHIDPFSGNDARDGRAPDRAWRSLEKVNATEFSPGDKVLFKAGGVWNGRLVPRGSGRVGDDGTPELITIGRYGEGPLPRIEGQGKVPDALLIKNVEFWLIEDLEITNHGEAREPWRTGVKIHARDFGKMRHIHLRRLRVRDVNGDLRKTHEGCGIYFHAHGGDSHFDGLWIEDCHVIRTDRNGIAQRGGRTRSRNVVIRGNLLEDIGGDGIKLWGTNGGLIERNVVRGARARCEDHAAGIWPFACDDTVIQFNEVSGTRGTKDGQGFDADYNCRRTLIQYNYSHGNEGGFMLVCGPGRSYNEATVIRYNISVRDGINSARVFHFGGKSSNTLVHNNTIVIGPRQDLPMILHTEWEGGRAQNTRFISNLFIVEEGGRVTYDFGTSTGNHFEGNVFVGRHEGLPEGIVVQSKMPPLAGPLAPIEGIDRLAPFRPLAGSDFPFGVPVDAWLGGPDFFGVEVPRGTIPRAGAAEVP